jgi:hypothetical protein
VRDWLKAYGAQYDRVEFNVRVSDGTPSARSGDEKTDRMWDHISKYRLDVVATRGVDVDIVEAKVQARFDAVTQVRNYVEHYKREYLTFGQVRPVIIARRVDDGVETVMGHAGGLVVLV